MANRGAPRGLSSTQVEAMIADAMAQVGGGDTNTALAGRVTGLEMSQAAPMSPSKTPRLDAAEQNIGLLQSSQQTQDGRLSALEDNDAAQADRLTAAETAALEAVANASGVASRVNSLESASTAQGAAIGVLQANAAGAPTQAALSAAVGRIAALEASQSQQDGQIAGLGTAIGSVASQGALETLSGRVGALEVSQASQDTAIASAASAASAAQTAANGKASSGDLQTAVGRIAALEASQSTQDAAIAGKASSSALTAEAGARVALAGRVSSLESSQSAQDTAIAAKATASDLTAEVNARTTLAGRVSALETSQATQDTTIAGKASASSVTSLGTRMTAAEAAIAALPKKVKATVATGADGTYTLAFAAGVFSAAPIVAAIAQVGASDPPTNVQVTALSATGITIRAQRSRALPAVIALLGTLVNYQPWENAAAVTVHIIAEAA